MAVLFMVTGYLSWLADAEGTTSTCRFSPKLVFVCSVCASAKLINRRASVIHSKSSVLKVARVIDLDLFERRS